MRRTTITSALTVATATVAAVRRGQRPAPEPAPVSVPAEPPPTPAEEPAPAAPDAGRWQGDELERLPRQPLYTMAASRGIPERRLTHMSREEILELLVGHDASRA